MKLVVISVSNAGLADLAYVNGDIAKSFPGSLEIKLFYAAKHIDSEEAERIQDAIIEADCIILDLMGASREYEQLVFLACQTCKGYIVPFGGDNEEIRSLLRLGSFTGKDMRAGMTSGGRVSPEAMTKMMNLAETLGKVLPVGKLKDMKNYIQIIKYWKNAEEENIRNMLYLIGRDYGGIRSFPKPREPIIIDDTGILEPRISRYYANVAAYRRHEGYDEDKPTIAILFYGHSYPNRTRGCVAAFIEKLKPFANVLPVAFARTTNRDLATLKDILINQTGKRVDLVVNFLAFRLGAGPMGGDAQEAIRLLEELDVPVMHPYFMSRREVSEWEQSAQGINSAEFLIQVMLPELDGCIETVPIGALGTATHNAELNIELHELKLIEERADKVAARIENWIKLRRKPICEKKIAVICYNYPPGEDNLFGGAFLDTFLSVERILALFKREGYMVDEVSAETLQQTFTAGKLVNSGRWMGDTANVPFIRYKSKTYSDRLGSTVWREKLEQQWGSAPGEIMTEDNDLLIPGCVWQNIFVGLQPTRGIHEQPDKLYHDKGLLPHHQYIAFYQWLKEEFKADVIVHVGTHGTLEFLPGKECGMSGACLPDYLISDIPHIYLYYAGNPAEAMIAKRRSHASLVSYQSPGFTESELYGELAELEGLLQQREEAKILDPGRIVVLDELIQRKARLQHLPCDLDGLEQELFRMRRSLIPQGLHIFGQGMDSDAAVNFMKFVLRYDRGELPSLQRLIAENKGIDYDMLLAANQVGVLSKLDQTAAQIVDEYVRTGKVPRQDHSTGKNEESYLEVLKYGYNAYKASLNCQEESGLTRILAGRYLPARLAGDMVRNPAVLPTGYNLYQFDPRQVPSAAAMARGSLIAKNTLEQYRKSNGGYPKSAAVVLWGLETSRTQGETLGQILHYLGVRTINKKNQFAARYEIIPQSELGRPRIDVVVNMCGFFRDMFPMLIDDLHELFCQIADLNEADEDNYLKANAAKVFNKLLAEGYDEETAKELSAARLFGPAEAEYGTKVSKLIELKNWTDENLLAETYVNSLQHVYSKSFRGKAVQGLLNTHLAGVDLVSQVRSNHEYEVTDLDHYYEYFGGLSKSVERAKGTKAQVYITDTTGEKIQTETVDRSIDRGVRTRLLNPKWIDAMLEHSYHGGQNINDRFENILGLAATTNQVDNWIFSELHQTYVTDPQMSQRLTENNRWAYYSMVERLLECSKRGYWQASEKELAELRRLYLDLEGEMEE
ncbi:magnesium chelatase subunit H [Dendrosporobacter sp. 1207_IL3150]|uniref:magnesium chelatase subunit H n=1 Tax=Dendrosporobacter sp. 1207_IL3150 TaxID=3084054 RepID=UPI002FD8C0B8